MQKHIKLAIPTPCHENWNSFAKTAQGGFCGSCQKEVIDFTGWSEDQLKMYFKKPSGNTCGRFKQEQLKVYTFEPTSSSKTSWLSFALVSLLVLFSSRQAAANSPGKFKAHTEQLQREVKSGKTILAEKDSSIVLQGKVTYAGDSSTLPGVTVVLKGTTNATFTDADGNFRLELESLSPSATLVINFIGLKTVEYAVNKNESKGIKIVMEADVITLGGTVVMGGISNPRWYNPRRWWWGIKSCFRN